MLFLAVVHHRGFQPSPKATFHLQACRGLRHFRLTALRAVDGVLAHFNHLCAAGGQFGDLIYPHQPPFDLAHIGLTVVATLRMQLHDLVGMGNHWTHMRFVSSWRSMFSLASLMLGFIAFLSPRRRLGRILGRGRRLLLVMLKLVLQCFMVSLQLPNCCLKLGQLFALGQEKSDQLLFRKVFKFVSLHRWLIVPRIPLFEEG